MRSEGLEILGLLKKPYCNGNDDHRTYTIVVEEEEEVLIV